MEANITLVEAYDFGTDCIAQYYFDNNKDCIIYTNKFFVFDGDLWKPYNDNSMINLLATYLSDKIYKEERLAPTEKQKRIKHITNKQNITSIKDYVKAKVLEHTIKNRLLTILDSSRDNVNYLNGLLDLKTGEFRKRTKTDYISRCLDYDYDSDKTKLEKEINHINEIFKRVCNNDDELYEFKKLWMAYCITGETKETKFLIESGVGGNGKSLMIEVMEAVFRIYVNKLGNKTFCSRNATAHKQIIETINKRITYIEEICLEKLDIESLKDYVNGATITCEKLFATKVEFPSQAKLMIICNKPPEFEPDEGIQRRGIVCEYRNKFVDDEKDVNEEKGIYLANKDLKYLFEKDSYKNAFMAILLPYAIKYYQKKKGLSIPKDYKSLFNDLCDENDAVKQFISDNFVITNNDDDRISKDDFTKYFNSETKYNYSFVRLLPDIKRYGLKYMKDWRVNGKRGVLAGIRFMSDDDRVNGEEEKVVEVKEETKVETKEESDDSDEEVIVNTNPEKFFEEKPKNKIAKKKQEEDSDSESDDEVVIVKPKPPKKLQKKSVKKVSFNKEKKTAKKNPAKFFEEKPKKKVEKKTTKKVDIVGDALECINISKKKQEDSDSESDDESSGVIKF